MSSPNGQSTVYTYQDSTTTGEPRLSEIKNLNSSSAVISKFDYGYDAQGQITSWTQQTDTNDPQNWALLYDNEGKLLNANVTDTVTNAVLNQYAYTYDAAGNRTSEQINGNIVSSSYNNLNQLTGQSAGGNMVFSGSLNKQGTVTVGGNPAVMTDSNTEFRGTTTVNQGTNNVPIVSSNLNGYAVTNNFQVVVPPTSGSYTYDLNGNLTNDGSNTYSWDAKNELVKITYTGGAYTAFTYNGLGQRVEIQEYNSFGTLTSTKQYVGGEERNASNQVTKRYFGQGEQLISGSTATNYFYTFDHLGSIREMIASDGSTIAARYSYDPFGRSTYVSGSVTSDFQFTGYYYHAASGLYLSATRAYNPNLGRFLQRDPSGEGSGLNLYAYAGDNPVCNVDPSGLNPVTDSDLNNEMSSMFSKINGNNLEGVPVSQMTWSQYQSFMLQSVTTNAYGGENAEADTSYHNSPSTYTYTGTQYPGLSGLTLTGHELNYMGVGAAMAGRGYSATFTEAVTIAYDVRNGEGYPSAGTMAATMAGYDAYQEEQEMVNQAEDLQNLLNNTPGGGSAPWGTGFGTCIDDATVNGAGPSPWSY